MKGEGSSRGPSLVVQGSRTAVHVGGAPPPGVDIDRVAAMMSNERGESSIFHLVLYLSMMPKRRVENKRCKNVISFFALFCTEGRCNLRRWGKFSYVYTDRGNAYFLFTNTTLVNFIYNNFIIQRKLEYLMIAALLLNL